MPYSILMLLWAIAIGSSFRAQSQEWKLIWYDEFSQSGLPDSTKWTFDTGGDGWGNDELQFYTNGQLENCCIKNGKLNIVAQKNDIGHNKYTSARLVTRHKAEWKYGRIEVRARLPRGKGSWPAIWMLPAISPLKVPEDGEMDIMEEVGFDPCNIHATIHCAAFNQGNKNLKSENIVLLGCNRDFHTYAMEWSSDSVNIFADGLQYFSFVNLHSGRASWPFDVPFYLVLNLAIGGSWGGINGIDDESFPQRMEIDYVRVYQKM